MLIENKQPRVVCLTGKYIQSGSFALLQSVDLRPGVNRVPAEKFAEVRECADGYIKRGLLRIVTDTDTDDLKGMPEAAAVAAVENTFDGAVLQDWKLTASKGVRVAIDRQLAEIRSTDEASQ